MNTENNNKMKELILYISEKLADDEKFGSTKLNKVLFFSDFLFYRFYGKSITGQEYQKLPNGPAPITLLPMRQEMIKEGSLSIDTKDYWGWPQHVPVAKRKSNLKLFTTEELSLIKNVIEDLRPYDASECSNLSHKFIGWELAKLQEKIPYEVALLAHGDDDTQEQMDYCNEMQRRAEKWLMGTI